MGFIKSKNFLSENFYLSGGSVVYGSKKGSCSVVLNKEKGWYELKVTDSSEVDKSLSLSHGLDYNEMTKYVFGTYPNTDLGMVQGTYLTQSYSEKRNFESSSGGGVKETLRYLFDEGKINSAIAVQRTGKLKYEPVKVQKEDVDKLPPSIYHVIDTSLTVKILKESRPDEKFAIVGSPWQIDDLYIYIKNCEPNLKKKIYLTIGLITGWYFSLHSVKALCHYYKIDYKKLYNITYRGKGKKGKIRFYDKSSELIKEVSRFNIKSKAASDLFYTVPAFLLYPNTQNMLADIVMGDPHLAECGFSKTGMNLTVVRTKKAEDVLRSICKLKYLKLRKIDNNSLFRSQERGGRLYGDFAFAYNEYLKSIGFETPNYITPDKEKVKLKPISEIEKFHKKYLFRLNLHREGKFFFLLLLKYKDEFLNLFQSFCFVKSSTKKILKFFKKRSKPTKNLRIFN